jgi:hypothetical protein
LRLAYALVPLGGIGVFLGLSMLTVTLLAAEGIQIPHLTDFRTGLLAMAALASLWLAARQTLASRGWRGAPAWLACVAAAAGCVVPWLVMFYAW